MSRRRPIPAPPITYRIGERNPTTLPGSAAGAESVHDNTIKSRYWRSLGRSVRSGALIGAKYV